MPDEPREPTAPDASSPRSPSRIDAADEQVAALLIGSFPPVDPDPTVWANIEAGINASPTVERSSRRPVLPWLLSIAAVAVIVVGVGTFVTRPAAADPAATYSLTLTETGVAALTIEVDANGTAVATPTNLKDLPVTQTYQLWAVVNDEVVSVGLLGHHPTDTPIRVEGNPTVLALSIERAGGVAVSEVAPVAVWVAPS